LNASYDVLTDKVYEVSFFVSAGASAGCGALCNSSAYASADPDITLGVGLLDEGYSIEFSPNLATTPLPSTWLMLLSGFVGLGLFAYRGTKKGSATAAV
jgi:hypothetical protein